MTGWRWICRSSRYLLFALLFGTVINPGFAKDFSQIYSPDVLRKAISTYEVNIRGVLYEDIRHYLSVSEKQTLSTVKVNFSQLGRHAGLFEYSMNLTTGEMTITALAVKFFDEIAIAFAWYEYRNLDRTKIIEYIGRLFAQPGYRQPPLPALGVPAEAWKLDKNVDDDSQKILKSAITFLLLHEFAHWRFRHAGYDAISNRQAQRQEKQADAFALEVMARMHTVPYGMVYWFMITGLLQSNEARTHPLSTDRLLAIADRLERRPTDFIGLENRNRVSPREIRNVAKEIRTIATTISNNKK